MTFSILARDPDSGELGAAAATGNLAVGAWVLYAEPDAGLVASQGFSTSTIWGVQALRRLQKGNTPQSIVQELTGADEGRNFRQLMVMDSRGSTAGWTGTQNTHSKGQIVEPDLAVAGNWLANEHVLPALRKEFLKSDGSLATRLLKALDAAFEAGGDARGLQSAAIKVVSAAKPPLDLRVDHSQNPLADLTALFELTKNDDYHKFLHRVPTMESPQRC